MSDTSRATPKQFRDFFESGPNGRKLSLSEMGRLKKFGVDGQELPEGSKEKNAYDQIAEGIGNGTLTY